MPETSCSSGRCSTLSSSLHFHGFVKHLVSNFTDWAPSLSGCPGPCRITDCCLCLAVPCLRVLILTSMPLMLPSPTWPNLASQSSAVTFFRLFPHLNLTVALCSLIMCYLSFSLSGSQLESHGRLWDSQEVLQGVCKSLCVSCTTILFFM